MYTFIHVDAVGFVPQLVALRALAPKRPNRVVAGRKVIAARVEIALVVIRAVCAVVKLVASAARALKAAFNVVAADVADRAQVRLIRGI